ncbi:ferrous iron transport protein A [Dyadobacter luteus]|jgi:ferrous iron transport protein A|uniref:Ferrous iron transport protein A n=1 Tax=Dyadobacter luteus TaxID=2259619 RepID=A0A3D8YCN8_9BACT|nr:FeoA family protein [Dyadobacter luteus]REA61586.1 ferrous iron transport protein A [Dyadobacter luteus]
MAERTVSHLKKGEKGIIKSFSDKVMSLKLLEMGCLPGSEVRLDFIAPFGDPICINVGGNYSLSLRLNEASVIILE